MCAFSLALALYVPASAQTTAGTRSDAQTLASAQTSYAIRNEGQISNPAYGADASMWALTPSTLALKADEPAALHLRNGMLGRFAKHILKRTSTLALNLTKNAMQFIGVPYVFGGTSPYGFDCSGYTQHVFAALGIHLPRMADEQYYAGHRVSGPSAGDLVFFQTYLPGPSHVGIYLGSGKFVHASSHGVMVSHLSDSYWASRYLGARSYIRH